MTTRERAGKEFQRLVQEVSTPAAEREAQQAAVRAVVERDLSDMGALRELQRVEQGIELSVLEEIREVANSTNIVELRRRRLWALLDRRAAEVTLDLCMRDDHAGMFANAWARGWRWNGDQGDWVANQAEPGKPTVRLRRIDRERDGSFEAFVYKTLPRGDLSLEALKAMVRAWGLADAGTRGPDPSAVWLKVTPDPKTGEFELPFAEAVKVYRAYRETNVRLRSRRNAKDPNPVVEECAPAAAYVPVQPRAAAQVKS